VSSIGGKLGEPFGCWYHATKFAVEGLSDSLRPELAPFGIHVVVVEPGAVRTEWGAIAGQHLRDASAKGPYAARAAATASVLESTSGPSRLSARPEVVAEAVARAATSRRPRTRYVVPTTAKVILLLRRVLPDRAFDRLLGLGYRMVAIGSR
jgi:NAD(P)-dependent dehydrogenase (short-subunit alcohol dehydrogenase family)